MRSVSYRLADLKKNVTVPLGFRGENEHTRIIIDCKKAFDEYPNAIPSLAVSPPNGTAYPAVIVREGDLVYWDIRDSDLAKEGRGTAQLTFTEDGVVRKDDIFNTVIEKSILPAWPAPDPIADWITEANKAIGTIEGAIETAQDAAEAASGSATAAAGSVAAAANQATAAAGSAEAARSAAGEAAQKANDAAESAMASASSATAAAGSANSADGSATQAAGSAEAAGASATAAAGSANNAAESATGAAGSAESAAASAAAAGQQATAAGSAASAAGTAQAAAETAQGKAEDAQEAAEAAAEGAEAAKEDLEEMLSAGVEDVVEGWLDNHPEATTTVEDGAVTWEKLNNSVQGLFNDENHSITSTSESGYTHEDASMASNVTFIGNEDAFRTAKYADKKNYAPPMTYNGTKYGVNVQGGNRFIELNGTGDTTDTFYISLNDFDPYLPAGDYRVVIFVDIGESVLVSNGQFVVSTYYAEGNTNNNIWLRNDDANQVITATRDIRRIAISGGIANGNVYSGYKLWFGIFPSDVSIVDTNHLVENGETYTAKITRSLNTIDTMQHQSTVTTLASIKDYVDGHTIDINAKLTYVTPEKYGAKGDGVTDDYLAIQSAITYGIQNNMPVRAYGNYFISQGLVIECDELDLYINKLTTATKTSEAVVKLTGYRNRITINYIYAFDGTCDGFLLYGKTAHWSEFNTIRIPYIVANKNAISVKADIDAYACTNIFHTQYLHSATMNCIYESYGFGENVFFGGGQMVCPSGWAIYLDHSGNNHFYNFALENRARSGIYIDNCISNEFKGFRIAELRGQKTASSGDTGTLIKFIGTSAFNLFECADIINQVDIDVSQATTNEDLSTYTGSLEVASNAINIIRGTGVRGHGWLDGDNTAYVTTYGKEIITLRNHKIVIPIGKLSYAVDADLDYTIFFAPVQATEFIMKQDATIKFNDSYCCIGFNEIIVDQTDGSAMIYDKNDQLIFDGQTAGTGVYRMTCVCDPDNNVWNTLKPTSNLKATLYDGENNIWKIERINYI